MYSKTYMTSYCHIQEAFNNDNNYDELDRMAREVNNKKKQQIKDIYKQFRKTQDSLCNSINAFENTQNNDLKRANLQSGDPNQAGYFSAQGNVSKYKPHKYDETIIKDIYNDNDSDHITIESPSEDSSLSSSLSSDSSLESFYLKKIEENKKNNKNIKVKSKKKKRKNCLDFDLNSVDSLESLDSGESLLSHAKKCSSCKDKLMKLIRKSYQKSINKKGCLSSDEYMSDSEDERPIIKRSNNSEGNSTPEMKELIMICLLGLLVIVILDIMMKGFR